MVIKAYLLLNYKEIKFYIRKDGKSLALYLGTEKVKLIIDGIVYTIKQLPSATPTLNSLYLLSKDGYILKDSEGVYITVKETD